MISNEDFNHILGQRIKELREAQKKSQTELGYECDKEKQTISKWEHGGGITAYSLYQIAEGLGICLSTLFDFEYDPKKAKKSK